MGVSTRQGWGLGVAAETEKYGAREKINETLEIDYIYKGIRAHMSADLRVRISNLETRYKIPVGFKVIPAPAGQTQTQIRAQRVRYP